MTNTETPPGEGNSAAQARAHAAALFAAAVADESVGHEARLNCIAAELALQTPGIPTPPTHLSGDALIRRALGVLAALPTHHFADPRVRTACRYARRALRGDS